MLQTLLQKIAMLWHEAWSISSFQVVYGMEYHQTYNVSRAKSQNLNASRLVLQLSLPNPLKPGVKSRMKM